MFSGFYYLCCISILIGLGDDDRFSLLLWQQESKESFHGSIMKTFYYRKRVSAAGAMTESTNSYLTLADCMYICSLCSWDCWIDLGNTVTYGPWVKIAISTANRNEHQFTSICVNFKGTDTTVVSLRKEFDKKIYKENSGVRIIWHLFSVLHHVRILHNIHQIRPFVKWSTTISQQPSCTDMLAVYTVKDKQHSIPVHTCVWLV